MSSFVPYQVDYAIQNTAKTLGFTKKKVLFKFGFANPDALRRGVSGAQCRGSEHELTFVWSLTSGKRQLFLDGRDVHFSESGQNGWTQDRAWQHAFTMKDATGTYRVHFISQPKNPDLPDSKPFDLRVAGVSYFSFNRIFQLGTPTMTVRENAPRHDGRHHHRSSGGRDSPMSPEERRAVAAAKVESLRDLRSHPQQSKSPERAPAPAAPKMPREEPNLLSFDDDPPAPPVASPQLQQPQAVAATGPSYGQFASSITLDSAWGGGGSGGSWEQPGPPQPQLQQQPSYGQPPTQQQPQYGQSAMVPSTSYGGMPGYGAPPPPPQQAPFGASVSSSSFGLPTASYGELPQAPPPQQASYSPFASTSYSSFPAAAAPAPEQSSTALTPYQAPTSVNTTAAPAPYAAYSSFAATPTSAGGAAAPPFASPSAQTYASYGSAPSFAQPPPPPVAAPAPATNFMASSSSLGGYGAPSPAPYQPQQPPPISPSTSFGGGYANPPPAPANPNAGYYGAPPPPPAAATPSSGYPYGGGGAGSQTFGFAAPPAQQQQQAQPPAYGYPPQQQAAYPGY